MSAAAASGGAFEGELTLLKRDGTVASRIGGVQLFTYLMAISPDERTVAAAIQDARSSAAELWRFDVTSGARTPLTSMRTSGGWAGSPVWSSNGTRMAYACQPPGILDDVCIRDMQTGAVTKIIESKAIWEHPRSWSADSQHMLVSVNDYKESSVRELRVWSAKTGTLSAYIQSSDEGVFSPDAQFVAFTSIRNRPLRSGRDDFSERRQTCRSPPRAGGSSSWNAAGNEILVATLTATLWPIRCRRPAGRFFGGPAQALVRNLVFDAGSRAPRGTTRAPPACPGR